MHPASTEQHRMAAVVAAAARLPKSRRAPDYKRFLETYYGSVDPEDMAARAPAELAGAALAHLKFAHTRRGRALVRVFNPTLREDGYTSPHTVIEVVNDDMPFLVDSIGLALTRASLTMHFLAHPIFAVSRDTAGSLRSIEERAAVADKHRRLESFQHAEVDRIVDPALSADTPVYPYDKGSWGPSEVDQRVSPPGGWYSPAACEKEDFRVAAQAAR